jgi:hypothetical protein
MSEAVATVGHNQPPTAIDAARTCFATLSKFLVDNPIIEAEETARGGAALLARAKNTIADIEAERKKLTNPLNDQLRTINAAYKKPRETIESIVDELASRLTAFARAEEEKRIAVAEQMRREAEELARIAREAEAAEQEAKDNAAQGEVLNVVQKIVEADHAFDQFSAANREAARAERDVPVRLGTGGIGRAVSMRTKETLWVSNWQDAMSELGLTEPIRDAILTSARAYRKLKGELPKGIISEITREI